MKLILGLGNIGPKYRNTRHNLGFAVVEMLAITFGGHKLSDFRKHAKAQADILDLQSTYGCILVKPTTMMNLSGQAVGELARYYKVPLEDLWVIYDDVDLQFGQLRVRKDGSSGGHNGVKSVIQHLGSEFWRVRLGVANDYLPTTPTDKFVLDNFTAEEAPLVPKILSQTANYLETALLDTQIEDHTQNLV